MSRSDITFHVDVPDEIPEVACSQSDLEQVFLNLLTNARDATPHGGTHHGQRARRRARRGDLHRRHWLWHRRAENLVRVLEPFFTTKPHGNGLGLSICRSVLWEVDGTLTIHSQPGNRHQRTRRSCRRRCPSSTRTSHERRTHSRRRRRTGHASRGRTRSRRGPSSWSARASRARR